jgi:hypothetical protein
MMMNLQAPLHDNGLETPPPSPKHHLQRPAHFLVIGRIQNKWKHACAHWKMKSGF